MAIKAADPNSKTEGIMGLITDMQNRAPKIIFDVPQRVPKEFVDYLKDPQRWNFTVIDHVIQNDPNYRIITEIHWA